MQGHPLNYPLNQQNTRQPLYRLKILSGVLSEFEKTPQEDERNFNQLIRSFGKLLTFTRMQWSLQPQFSIKKLSKLEWPSGSLPAELTSPKFQNVCP